MFRALRSARHSLMSRPELQPLEKLIYKIYSIIQMCSVMPEMLLKNVLKFYSSSHADAKSICKREGPLRDSSHTNEGRCKEIKCRTLNFQLEVFWKA